MQPRALRAGGWAATKQSTHSASVVPRSRKVRPGVSHVSQVMYDSSGPGAAVHGPSRPLLRRSAYARPRGWMTRWD